MFHLEPEPMKNGSAPQHWYDIKSTLLNALKLMYVEKVQNKLKYHARIILS